MLRRIADLTNPKDRMVQVVRWYMGAFHAGRPSEIAKKPYNPILGETFKCHWHVPDIVDEKVVEAYDVATSTVMTNFVTPSIVTNFVTKLIDSVLEITFRIQLQMVLFLGHLKTIWFLLPNKSHITLQVSLPSTFYICLLYL